MKTGIRAFLDIAAAAGITHVFGNPGTTELPFNDALVDDPSLRYIFGVHEIPVTAMADGFAMATGKPAIVNLHASCGLGNAMGMIYNAHVEGTPLIITAGQQDQRLLFGDPVLAGDLVGMAKPCVKWAHEVTRVGDLPNATRRAIQIAMTPPTGPVFLSLPLDVQMAVIENPDLRPPTQPQPLQPTEDCIQAIARALVESRNPAVIAGSRVTEAKACDDLLTVAQLLGCPVYTECNTSHGRLPMRPDSSLYQGPLPLWSPDVRETLARFDTLFVVGMNLLRLYIVREPEVPIPATTRIIHADSASAEIGKNFPVDLAMAGNLAAGLQGLVRAIKTLLDMGSADGVRDRIAHHECLRDNLRAQLRQRVADERSLRPISALTLMDCLAETLPHDVAIVDEAATTGQHFLERVGLPNDPYAYFAHRGWALGWGIGCALGVKLAWPNRPVLGLIGDGAAMYGLQGLWSAAHHQIPVTFVVANNAQYKILKVCGDLLPLPQMARRKYLGMDLTQPEIDFVALASALGVEAHRVSEPDEIRGRLRDSWNRDRPILFDIPLQR